MKKNKLNKQLRKIETRNAMEKRRAKKGGDPFSPLVAQTDRHSPIGQEYDDFDYENEYGEYYHG